MSACPNCDGRVCMDCVTRTVHDDCGDSPCPVCSPNADSSATAATPVPQIAQNIQRKTKGNHDQQT